MGERPTGAWPSWFRALGARLLVSAGVAGSACGPTAAGPPRPARTVSPATRASAPRARPAPPPASSPGAPSTRGTRGTLGAHAEPPPAGVPATFTYRGGLMGWGRGGAYGCPGAMISRKGGVTRVHGALYVYPSSGAIPVHSQVTVCVTGVPMAGTATVVIRGPTGARRRLTGLSSSQVVMRLPQGPPGPYEVIATVGARRYAKSLVARAVTRPTITLLDHTPPAGLPIPVALSGLPPRAAQRLYVYRLATTRGPAKGKPPVEIYHYVTAPSFQTDAHGQAEVTLRTRPDAPATRYVLGLAPGRWITDLHLATPPKKPQP